MRKPSARLSVARNLYNFDAAPLRERSVCPRATDWRVRVIVEEAIAPYGINNVYETITGHW